MTRPQPNEAAPYYSRYIDLIDSDNILVTLGEQLTSTLEFLSDITEETSLQNYEPGKWTIREVLNHVNDAERVFLFRAFWFARGFQDPLASYDQEVCAEVAKANDFSWQDHIEDFRSIRSSTLTFFKNLSADAWLRTGIAAENSFTVRSLAYIIAGHVEHHRHVIRDRYLTATTTSA